MVPFMKTSADKQATTAKSLAVDSQKMRYFNPVNDDTYQSIHYGAPETKIAAE